MKVVWFSHHKERGGWAEASRNSILALDSVGVDVVPVNVPLTGEAEVPRRILELEKGNADDADYCVQNVLPHHMVATDQYKKNVGFFVTETSTIAHTPWVLPLSSMDELWVPNLTNAMRTSSDIPSMKSHIKVMPYAFDKTSYESVYDDLDLGPASKTYKFYYIGDLNDRKNLEATMRCYQAEFHGAKDVTLVLKVNAFGKSNEEVSKAVNAISQKVKQDLRMFKSGDDYCDEMIIPGNMDRKTLLSLHNTCDCYVSTSHGEGWGIPIYEAFCLGNPVIACNEGGPKDFLANHDNLLINGSLSPCKHRDSAFPFLGTGREFWFNVSESGVMGKMRQCYKEKPSYRKAGMELAKHFSYEAIGHKMKEALKDDMKVTLQA